MVGAEPPAESPIDPDVDLTDPRQRAEVAATEWVLLAAIAAGGVIGAETRYGLARALAHPADGFPWSTLITNVLGCLLIGGLMAALADRPHAPRLARPFLGVGVLGGFTTYSTFAVDTVHLTDAGRIGVAALYVATTLVAGTVAVVIGGRLRIRPSR